MPKNKFFHKSPFFWCTLTQWMAIQIQLVFSITSIVWINQSPLTLPQTCMETCYRILLRSSNVSITYKQNRSHTTNVKNERIGWHRCSLVFSDHTAANVLQIQYVLLIIYSRSTLSAVSKKIIYQDRVLETKLSNHLYIINDSCSCFSTESNSLAN